MVDVFAFLIEPLPAGDAVTPLADTFREVDAREPALRVGELSTQRGDGIFETVAVINGYAQEVEAHLARLQRSAALCDLPAPHLPQWRAVVAQAVAVLPRSGEFALRMVLSRGVEHGPAPTAWLTVAPSADFAGARERGIRVVTLERGYAHDLAERAPWLLLGAKTLSYAVNMAAIREARRRGADDVIFVSSDGFVLEGPTSTVVLRFGAQIVTPRPSASILHGTTQLSLFEHLQAQGTDSIYRDVPVADLVRADAAWLVSSVRLAAPITAIDGTPLPTRPDETAAFNAYLRSPRD